MTSPTRRLDGPRSSRDSGNTQGRRNRQAEHTHRLLAKAQRCSGESRRRLEQEAALLNMDMARSIAARYWGRGEPSEDLVQVAFVGLMKAIRGYTPGRGDFRSYAIPTIAGEVKRHFRDRSWTVKAPRWIQELQADISAVSDGLAQELQRSPRPAETAHRLGVPEHKVNEALSADGCFAPTSLDGRGPNGDGYALTDRLGVEDRDLDRAETRIALAPLIESLPERDRQILNLRFFHGWTQSQIADDLGITQMHVSRLLNRTLKHLRTQLTAS